MPAPTTAEVGWKAIEERNRDLDIRLDKLPPGWNGRHVYWSRVIEEVVRADPHGMH